MEMGPDWRSMPRHDNRGTGMTLTLILRGGCWVADVFSQTRYGFAVARIVLHAIDSGKNVAGRPAAR